MKEVTVKFCIGLLLIIVTRSGYAKIKTAGKYTENGLSTISHISKDGTKKKFDPGIDDIDMYPSWKVCKASTSPDYYESTDIWQFGCSDCLIKFQLISGDENGGHNTSGIGSDNHTGTRPLGKIQDLDLDEWYPLEGYGTITYEASDFSGEVVLRATIHHLNIVIPDEVHDINIYVYVPGLVDAGGYNIFTTNNITSHLQNNRHLTQSTLNSFIGSLINWRNTLTAGGTSNNDIPVPNSEGLSLLYGGLFDVAKNFSTSSGHCNHRKGIDIDVGMSNIKNLLEPLRSTIIDQLEDSMLDFGFEFPETSEGPSATPTQWSHTGFHWHAKYPI